MERKEASLDLKDINETGEFVGHASVFGNIDLGGDVITKGAFRKSINDNGGRFPLLDGHSETVGAVVAEEDGYGLKSRAKSTLKRPSGAISIAICGS